MQNWNEIFDYKDGELYWKRTFGQRAKAGSQAGYIRSDGYKVIAYEKRIYKAHRIIWEMHNWPIPSNKEIDHKDQNKSNNRIDNLRCCSHAQNAQNPKLSVKNTSGHRGVMWYKPLQKWAAYIRRDGKRKHLGYFDDINDAIAARLKAEHEIGWNQF